MYYLGTNKAILKTTLGLKLYVNTTEKSITPHLATDGYWEPTVTKFITNFVKPGWQIIEVGSNIGYYSTIMAGKVKEGGFVHCFEPNPWTRELLTDNLEVNGFKDRSHVYPQAVSDRIETRNFVVLQDHQVSSTLLDPWHVDRIENGLYKNELRHLVEVETVHLDHLFFSSKIDFIKIDAEGFEYRILQGMKKVMEKNPKTPIMMEFVPSYLECANQGSSVQLLHEIRTMGYTISRINEQGTLDEVKDEDVLNRHWSELIFQK